MYLQTFKTFVKGETNKVLHETFVEDRHLVARYENNWAGGSRFERVGSQMLKANGQIGLPLRNFFFFIFLTPQCTSGTKNTKNTNTGTPSKWFSFRKHDERG